MVLSLEVTRGHLVLEIKWLAPTCASSWLLSEHSETSTLFQVQGKQGQGVVQAEQDCSWGATAGGVHSGTPTFTVRKISFASGMLGQGNMAVHFSIQLNL